MLPPHHRAGHRRGAREPAARRPTRTPSRASPTGASSPRAFCGFRFREVRDLVRHRDRLRRAHRRPEIAGRPRPPTACGASPRRSSRAPSTWLAVRRRTRPPASGRAISALPLPVEPISDGAVILQDSATWVGARARRRPTGRCATHSRCLHPRVGDDDRFGQILRESRQDLRPRGMMC